MKAPRTKPTKDQAPRPFIHRPNEIPNERSTIQFKFKFFKKLHQFKSGHSRPDGLEDLRLGLGLGLGLGSRVTQCTQPQAAIRSVTAVSNSF